MRRMIGAAAAAAAVVGFAASALEGDYVAAAGYKVTFAGGKARAVLPEGQVFANGQSAIEVPAVIDEAKKTMTLPADPADPTGCPSTEGVYSFVEDEKGVTFTVVSDPCADRAASITAGPWTKAPAQ